MKKVLFSNPPWFDDDGVTLRSGVRAGSRWPFTRPAPCAPDAPRIGHYLPFPFFLGYAASYVAKYLPDHAVTVRDSIARAESYESYFSHLKALQPDWLIIESASPSWAHDLKLIGVIAELFPRLKIIVTGPIASAEAAHAPGVVAAVSGEYEKGVLQVIEGRTCEALVPHALLTQAEMRESPAPMYDEAVALYYWDACPSGQQWPHLQVWTSRGCPFRCIFCVWPAVMTGNDPDGTGPRKVRFYSPEQVKAHILDRLELSLLAGRPIKSIYIDDDTFNLSEKHTLAICDVMREIGLPWSAMCRADTISLEGWTAMKDAGCFGVKVGVESGSQEVVTNIVRKQLDLDELERVILPHLKRIGLAVHTTWTVGLPGETEEQRQQTLAMIARLTAAGLHSTHQLSGTAEIEGTPLATLRSRGHLDAYAAAVAPTGAVQADGVLKLQQMQRPALT